MPRPRSFAWLDRWISRPAPAQEPGQSVAERLGYPADARLLMLHADDFGMAHSQNLATMEALEKGWVNSASIMVPCPWFPEAAAWARQHPEADIGLHLTLNSEWKSYRWRGLTTRPGHSSLLDAEGYLPLLASEVIERARPRDVEMEARAQVEAALSAGIRLTHIDAHMLTATCSEELLRVYLEMGRRYDLPVLLERDGQGIQDEHLQYHGLGLNERTVPVDRILGIRPGVGPDQWMEAHMRMLEPLPPGIYMLMLHLAWDDEEMRGLTGGIVDWGSRWRQSDFDLVASSDFQTFIREQGFIFVDWRELSRIWPLRRA